MDFIDDSKTVVRIIVIVILFACAIMAKLITSIIGNYRLSRLSNNLFRFLVILTILRTVAAWVDGYFKFFTIDVFSNIIAIASYLYIFYLLLKLYMGLRRRENEIYKKEGSVFYYDKLNKEKLSSLIDGVFDELKANKIKTDNLHNTLENNLKNYD